MSLTREILVSLLRSPSREMRIKRSYSDLREHAIFTLHNILKGHAENQAVVDAIKPAGEWGEDGMLRDTPGAVRK